MCLLLDDGSYRLKIQWRDKKAFTKDMKNIYNVPTKQAEEAALEDFAAKWESK